MCIGRKGDPCRLPVGVFLSTKDTKGEHEGEALRGRKKREEREAKKKQEEKRDPLRTLRDAKEGWDG